MTITKADKQSWKLEFLLEEERNEDGSARNSFDKVQLVEERKQSDGETKQGEGGA